MKNYKLLFALTLLFVFALNVKAQYAHGRSDQYIPSEDSPMVRKLHHQQDQKFGMLTHWKLCSVAGIVESWSVCLGEADWMPRDSAIAYEDYKKWYWGLKDSFNPTRLSPEQWTRAAKAAGMRCAIFTTRHHDGFNMFNTVYSDSSISKGPFKTDPRTDVAKYVFEAFRSNDLMVRTYFSKSDRHSEYYWWPCYTTSCRTQDYNIEKNPWRWDQFKEFAYNQVSELMHSYGSIDILWLDGGWINNPGTQSALDMDRISQMARKAQPGTLLVDRTIRGKYGNYQIPEQQIPDKQLPYPWETCMAPGVGWRYTPHAVFESLTTVIAKLTEVVAKGGSSLLGVGPTPEGILQEEIVNRLDTIREWMTKSGPAIYNTVTTPDYHSGGIWFTMDKDKKTMYALYSDLRARTPPDHIEWEDSIPAKGGAIYCLQSGKKVRWEIGNNRVRVYLPQNLKTEVNAFAFSFAPQ